MSWAQRLSDRTTRPVVVAALALALGASGLSGERARAQAGPAVKPVAPTALQALLPAPAGWTRGKVSADRFEMSPTAAYTAASAMYTKDEMKLKVTIADSAKVSDALIALATTIQTLPENYSADIPPATTVKRLTIKDSPASERWNAETNEGELTALIGGRFIVKVEGSSLDSADTLHTILQQVDFQKLAGLK